MLKTTSLTLLLLVSVSTSLVYAADADGDGVDDDIDNCPVVSNSLQIDTDMDTLGDICDNCPGKSNINQANLDGDALGDACEPPEAHGFWPATAASGNLVHIFGLYFNEAGTSISFNGLPALGHYVLDSTHIIAIVPAGDTSGPVIVTTQTGSDATPTRFSAPSSNVVIDAFWPSSGRAGQMTHILGSNFDPVNNVITYNGVPSAGSFAIDATHLVAIAPVQLETGVITVTTPSSSTTSESAFIAIPEFNPNDYPSLKHFWRMEETALPLIDDVAGVQWTPPVAAYDSQLRAWLIGDSSTVANATGNPRPHATPVNGEMVRIPASSDILIIAAGRTVAGSAELDNDGKDTGHPVDFFRIVMGDFENPDMNGFSNHVVGASNRGNTHPGLYSSTGFVSNDYITQPGNYTGSVDEDIGIYASFVRNGGDVTCGIVKPDGARPNTYRLPFSTDLVPPIEHIGTEHEHGEINIGSFMHADGAKFYGIALFVFENGLAADVDDAIEWMINNWKDAEPEARLPYPNWKGLR